MPGAYAEEGVDYTHLQPFKDRIKAMGARTLDFPRVRNVRVEADDHGSRWWYVGGLSHKWAGCIEGLGNKNWLAEWMYIITKDPIWFAGIGIDTILMATNDLIAQGALPVVYHDLVVVGDDSWFLDEARSQALIDSMYQGLKMTDMALPAGETPAYKYLVRSMAPVKAAPTLDGHATGIIAPIERQIRPAQIKPGQVIVGVRSSGMHANGASLVFGKGLQLKDQFLTVLPNGKTLGEEALIPTVNYLPLVEALLNAGVAIRCFLPGTGDGVAKLAFDKRPMTYRVTDWLDESQIPPLMLFMRDACGISLEDCLKTFNWGMGYYIFIDEDVVDQVLAIAAQAGFEAMVVGRVEAGERQVIFEPAGLTLPPPGE
jgi:phosphoribosylformylglycinamidine cyclo-ligase